MSDAKVYTHCTICGASLLNEGQPFGYAIVSRPFSPGNGAGGVPEPLHDGYLCGNCAAVAWAAVLARAPKLACQVCRTLVEMADDANAPCGACIHRQCLAAHRKTCWKCNVIIIGGEPPCAVCGVGVAPYADGDALCGATVHGECLVEHVRECCTCRDR